MYELVIVSIFLSCSLKHVNSPYSICDNVLRDVRHGNLYFETLTLRTSSSVSTL